MQRPKNAKPAKVDNSKVETTPKPSAKFENIKGALNVVRKMRMLVDFPEDIRPISRPSTMTIEKPKERQSNFMTEKKKKYPKGMPGKEKTFTVMVPKFG